MSTETWIRSTWNKFTAWPVVNFWGVIHAVCVGSIGPQLVSTWLSRFKLIGLSPIWWELASLKMLLEVCKEEDSNNQCSKYASKTIAFNAVLMTSSISIMSSSWCYSKYMLIAVTLLIFWIILLKYYYKHTRYKCDTILMHKLELWAENRSWLSYTGWPCWIISTLY